jgi:glycerophosphoryl diester phosphodiesterase
MNIADSRPRMQGAPRRARAGLRRWLIGLLVVLCVPVFFATELASSAYTASAPQAPLARLHERPSPLRWPAAHRGDHRYSPENSREAIRRAAQAGIPLIEVDVRRNASGALLLFHDARLDTHNAVGPEGLMGRRLESLDDRALESVQLHATAPVGIATYAEALDAIRPYRTVLQLDIKGESRRTIDQAVRIAQARGQAPQILIQCQRPSTLAYVRRRYPDIAVLARARSPAEVRRAFRKLPDFIQIDADWMTPALVEEIHGAGSKILVKSLYEADTMAQWERLFDAGIDVVLTGKAVEMAQYLNAASALRATP